MRRSREQGGRIVYRCVESHTSTHATQSVAPIGSIALGRLRDHRLTTGMTTRMSTRAVFVTVMLLSGTQLGGQSSASAIPRAHFLHHTSWGAEAGLPGGAVRSIQRSEDGYLWVGTNSGLYRFDGVRFTLMDGRRDSLLHVVTPGRWTVGEFSKRGTMWIGRPDGVLLEYSNGSFRALVRQTGPLWRTAVEGANGVIWLEREQRLVAWRDGRLIPLPAHGRGSRQQRSRHHLRYR